MASGSIDNVGCPSTKEENHSTSLLGISWVYFPASWACLTSTTPSLLFDELQSQCNWDLRTTSLDADVQRALGWVGHLHDILFP